MLSVSISEVENWGLCHSRHQIRSGIDAREISIVPTLPVLQTLLTLRFYTYRSYFITHLCVFCTKIVKNTWNVANLAASTMAIPDPFILSGQFHELMRSTYSAAHGIRSCNCLDIYIEPIRNLANLNCEFILITKHTRLRNPLVVERS